MSTVNALKAISTQTVEIEALEKLQRLWVRFASLRDVLKAASDSADELYAYAVIQLVIPMIDELDELVFDGPLEVSSRQLEGGEAIE